ncbi:MAG: thiamine pyrophosphate-dependent enzyme [archaeon]
MMEDIKKIIEQERKFVPGHATCSGCGIPIVVRNVLRGTKNPIIAAAATGCLEVTSTTYPNNAWNIPFVHSCFGNSHSTMAGVETAFRALKKKGKVTKDIKFVAFAGDGGTYDIGLQSLSGTLERNHNVVLVCYNNQAYMNTGNQRSSATEFGAETSTTPVGAVKKGKDLFRKDLTKIVAAHNIPYIGQSAVHNFRDIIQKAEKAFNADGPAFLNIYSPCTLMWKIPTDMTVEITKLAADTCFWPLYEIENGKYKLNYKPAQKKPLEDFLKPQGRFKHLLAPENKQILEKLKQKVDRDWEELLRLCGEK